MNYSLQGIGYFGLVSLRNDPLKKTVRQKKTESRAKQEETREKRPDKQQETTRLKSAERSEQKQQKLPCGLSPWFSGNVRQRVERSGSGKDGLMRRSEGELGSGM